LWDLHFRDPEPAFAQAQALLAEPANVDARTRAWCELTIAFHHLFFTAHPLEAKRWIAAATDSFAKTGERRGALLAEIAAARLAIVERSPIAARDRLLALYPMAQQVLPQLDRFWLLNAIGAAHFFSDRMDDAIRFLYEALETLRGSERSPQHSTVMSNLAAALITVGDYPPARELAEAALAELENHNNAQLVLFARSNLAEALSGLGEDARALELTEQMLADAPVAPRRAAQNHYMGIAAEVLARHGRVEEAARCAETARAILADFPGGYNEVHARWADAVVADAQDDRGRSLELLTVAAEAAERHRYLPGECKAWARLAERHAQAGDFEGRLRRFAQAARRADRTTVASRERQVLHAACRARTRARTRRARPRTFATERDRAAERGARTAQLRPSAQDDPGRGACRHSSPSRPSTIR
jgi:tetratricopeptide (TPR) repeat protein